MTRNVVAVSRVPLQPWRNGGGSTRELRAWPQAAGWRLRVSVATIAQDGPFSAFPGIGRWFTVISGAGVLLALPGGEQRMTPETRPLQFDGAAAPGCRLIAGPTDDLNLMAASSAMTAGTATMWRAAQDHPMLPGSQWRGVFAADAAQVHAGTQAVTLQAGSLLWTDSAEALTETWQLLQPTRAWCMELRA